MGITVNDVIDPYWDMMMVKIRTAKLFSLAEQCQVNYTSKFHLPAIKKSLFILRPWNTASID